MTAARATAAAAAAKKKTSPDEFTVTLGGKEVTFARPEPGQVAALRRAGILFESSDASAQNRGAMLFLDVLDGLVTEDEVLDKLYQQMASKEVGLEDYAECAIILLKHFGEEADKAPKNGPVVGTRRARARTR